MNRLKSTIRGSSGWLTLGAIFVASVIVYWHGFGPVGDAERYVAAAMRWVNDGPYLGQTHWGLRHLFVLPMAAALTLMGPSEFSATFANIAYAGGLVAITYFFMRRYGGEVEALAAGVLAATSAFFVSRTIEIAVYGPETFFLALSCWLFISAQSERRRVWRLMAAGVCAGFAWTLREQTIAILPALFLCSLVLKRQPLISIVAIGAGFGAIILGELIIYTIAAGNPLYRYEVDLHHRSTGWRTLNAAADNADKMLWRPVKDSFTETIFTPTLILTALLAVYVGTKAIIQRSAARLVLLVFGVASVTSLLVSAYIFDLALPRYYPIFPYSVILLAALAIARIRATAGIAWAGAAVAVIVAINVLGFQFSNYNEYAEARRFARLVANSDEAVYSDPLTASRARHYLLLSGLSRDEISVRVRSIEPPPGALYFRAYSAKKRYPLCVLGREDARPPNWLHEFLRENGLDRRLGARIRSIVKKPSPVEWGRVIDERSPIDSANCLAPAPKK